jgi:hypothetical protein
VNDARLRDVIAAIEVQAFHDWHTPALATLPYDNLAFLTDLPLTAGETDWRRVSPADEARLDRIMGANPVSSLPLPAAVRASADHQSSNAGM